MKTTMMTFKSLASAIKEHTLAISLWLLFGYAVSFVGFFIYPSLQPDIQVLLTFALAELITLKPLIRILKKPK